MQEARQPPRKPNASRRMRARRESGLPDLHVHDLRHAMGMRPREAGVPESTVADILWHSSPSMTRHYSMAQIVELHAALESPQSPPAKKNGLDTEASNP